MINVLSFRIAVFSLLLFLVAACTGTNSQDEGQSLIEQKKYNEALDWYNRKIEAQSKVSELKELYYHRAITYHKLNNFDAALNDINWALVIDSANASYYGEKGDLYFAKYMMEDALIQYHNCSKLEPANGLWPYKTGKTLLIQDEPAQATAALEKAEKLGYNDSDLFVQLGIAYQRAGNKEKSCTYFTKAAGMKNKEAQQFSKNLGCS